MFFRSDFNPEGAAKSAPNPVASASVGTAAAPGARPRTAVARAVFRRVRDRTGEGVGGRHCAGLGAVGAGVGGAGEGGGRDEGGLAHGGSLGSGSHRAAGPAQPQQQTSGAAGSAGAPWVGVGLSRGPQTRASMLALMRLGTKMRIGRMQA